MLVGIYSLSKAICIFISDNPIMLELCSKCQKPQLFLPKRTRINCCRPDEVAKT